MRDNDERRRRVETAVRKGMYLIDIEANSGCEVSKRDVDTNADSCKENAEMAKAEVSMETAKLKPG